ncbi:cellulose synthase/poly-beta-1,6-N-acetylglucosamine synthase-like glycosyltransferase [Bacteroides zoogleoformans]|uniref:Glycosyl transferase family 2 n=1 Tax=Bacteroides zoogleoformans TaxID=28119 RepID=A0ABN5IHR3_9BACE|nr:glycosyltransferase family 2 protein [Bacteroides zoogleoformans]AVM52054.1 glycosyl transferase family 2 [Bacteroides zoogleoformans]TWJ13986.1 cellulose synthase/poly-beta-1,6-N-acetylglucosamine synthase-like glycosyltransferase [Bacteroides zoogleoformans]
MAYILHIIDWFLYIVFGINVLYLLVYSVASCRRSFPLSSKASLWKRFAILIPAYREDAVIHECVHSCLEQDYPPESFDIVVISDRMQPETNASLASMPIRLIEVNFEHSTKSKALNTGMAAIGNEYDIALVLDADNVIPYNYLSDINDLFAQPQVEVVQTHRIAKNLNSDMAFLDAISEEINNSIFRLGHANLGLSAALIGSGMAFRYDLFCDTMTRIKAVGGFDRELELTLLYRGKRFHYLPDTFVFDEKIQNVDDFSRQRRRWLSAQWHYCRKFSGHLGKAIIDRNWDFCDKFFQQLSIPRLLLLGFTFLLSVLVTFYSWQWGMKWWLLLTLLLVALLLAVPRRLCTSRLGMALQKLPHTFWLMVGNLFKLRGANKSFIHTKHGVIGK